MSFLAAACALSACALSHRGYESDVTTRDESVVDGGLDVAIDRPRVEVVGDAPDAPVSIDVVDAGTCAAGEMNCGSGCVRLDTPDRCGSCARNCMALPGVAPASVRCTAGACVLTGACLPGRANCNTAPDDGCETDLSRSPNCGACGVTCTGAIGLCAASGGTFTCMSSCAAGLTVCGASCVNFLTDVNNCGSCANRCPGPASGSGFPVCTGTCSFRCNMGSHICGNHCALDTSTSECGPACTPCVAPLGGTVTCSSAGTCIPACTAPARLCPGNACVIESVTSCSPTCAPCPGAPANGRIDCTGSMCAITCMAGFALVGGTCVAMPCGNRALDAGESCDDGNRTSGDGCSATCQMEPATVVENCGATTTSGTISPPTGISIYSGTTAGRTDDGSGSCSANGPEVVLQFRMPAGTMVTVTLRPTGYDAALRTVGACSGSMCINMAGSGGVEAVTFAAAPGSVFAVVPDGNNPSDSGPFTVQLNIF